ISGNGFNPGNGSGIHIFSSIGNVVQGNYIGTDVNGTANLGNSVHGVVIDGSSNNNTIGGTTGGATNIIAFNGGDGVFVNGPVGNAILSNSIWSNHGLGIDLGPDGVTPNDPGDPDTGSNNLQNFPVLASAVIFGSTLEIDGTLNSTANST